MKNTKHTHTIVWVSLLLAFLAGPIYAQTDDVFDFIPSGGRTLLAQIITAAPANEVQNLLGGKHDHEGWREYLKTRASALPELEKLYDQERLTLESYLAFNMPLPVKSIPANPAKANWEKLLPPDGRDMALDNCQFCHIITVVVTQDKAKVTWQGTMNSPSHIEIKLDDRQREALAEYLVLNAAIPIDLVPEELRAGGASY